METLKKILSWLVDKPLITKIGFIIGAIAFAIALVFSSCSSWRNASIGGYHKVDKNVQDSVYYESSWSK